MRKHQLSMSALSVDFNLTLTQEYGGHTKSRTICSI